MSTPTKLASFIEPKPSAHSEAAAPLNSLEAPDYKEIEQSLLACRHGRWFLAQHLERNRATETRALLEALTRLEAAASVADRLESMKGDILKMFAAFAQTRKEIARIKPPADAASCSPFARYAFAEITKTMEHATHAVLEAAEDIQSAVQTLRDKGAEERYCMTIERQLSQVHRACAAHDHTLQRNVKIVELLGHLESELMAIIEGWERRAADADDDASESVRPAEPRPAPLRPQVVEELAFTLLNETQKLALFT